MQTEKMNGMILGQRHAIDAMKEHYCRMSLIRGSTRWPADVNRVLNFLNGHLFEFGLSVQHMRNQCRVSQNNFSMKFRYFTGTSPSEYVRNHRIGCSVTILEAMAAPVSITWLAYEVGYEHPSTFCMAFKKVTGATPQKYRAELKKKKNSIAKKRGS